MKMRERTFEAKGPIMGLFGNMFGKKACSICGETIAPLDDRKLEDGNLCKECASRLSPFFGERRQSARRTKSAMH